MQDLALSIHEVHMCSLVKLVKAERTGKETVSTGKQMRKGAGLQKTSAVCKRLVDKTPGD